MAKKRVLYISHGHPAFAPGGGEAYTLELYQGMRKYGDFDPYLLARIGQPQVPARPMDKGTPIRAWTSDPNQYLIYTNHTAFDWLNLQSGERDISTQHFPDFLRTVAPDVVHFQHTAFLGCEIIRVVRNLLPQVPIIYTLHEYLPICYRQGQMVRTLKNELCSEESPIRCNECFTHLPPEVFFLRKRFIQSHFALVDQFLAPSRFLMERYRAWGISENRIRFEEYGRVPMSAIPATTEDRPRTRLGYFGQLGEFKGVNVLLKAMHQLQGRAGNEIRLWMHGANLSMQEQSFQSEIATLLSQASPSVTFVGRYSASEIARLMANIDWVVIPSIWWENSPLVIQEAFAHGRPVICSNIGGMAEKVTDGVNGLHFRVGDPVSLAETIARAVSTPGLWDKLRTGIPPVYDIRRQVAVMNELYTSLGERRQKEISQHAQ